MELKKAYNYMLERYCKGVMYLDNQDIKIEERLEWEGEFIKILTGLNQLLEKIGTYTKSEVIGGFKI